MFKNIAQDYNNQLNAILAEESFVGFLISEYEIKK